MGAHDRHMVEDGGEAGAQLPPLAGSGEMRLSWRGAFGLLLGMRLAIRAQRKADAPEIVILNDKASRVVKRAEALAREGRLDEDAVAELRREAGRSRHALTDARQNFRARGEHLEWRHYNRAVRLLDAAISKTPVAREDPAHTERLDVLERLSGLDREVAFNELAAREPRLLTVRDKITSLPAKPWPRSPGEMSEDWMLTKPIFNEIRPLVGSERADHDPVLASQTAYAICTGYLRGLRYTGEPPKFDRPAP